MLPALGLAALFVASILRFDLVESALAPIATRKAVFVEREHLSVLALQHLALVAATALPAFLAAFGTAVAVAGSGSSGIRNLIGDIASTAETFPMVALMALLVPSSGYGFPPVAVALFVYGFLPVFRNTLAGIESTPAAVVDAARGCGMSERQILLAVRLPWAWPLVLQGLRVMLVIDISAATAGAIVGAGGLGSPILSGIRSFDPVLILKGSIPVALLALCVDSALRAVERSVDETMGRRPEPG